MEIAKCPTLVQTIEIQKKRQVSKQDRKNRQVSNTCIQNIEIWKKRQVSERDRKKFQVPNTCLFFYVSISSVGHLEFFFDPVQTLVFFF